MLVFCLGDQLLFNSYFTLKFMVFSDDTDT